MFSSSNSSGKRLENDVPFVLYCPRHYLVQDLQTLYPLGWHSELSLLPFSSRDYLLANAVVNTKELFLHLDQRYLDPMARNTHHLSMPALYPLEIVSDAVLEAAVAADDCRMWHRLAPLSPVSALVAAPLPAVPIRSRRSRVHTQQRKRRGRNWFRLQ